jgi:hypothetical protein
MIVAKKFDTEREASDFRRIIQAYCPKTKPRIKGAEVRYEEDHFDYEKCLNSFKLFGLNIEK